jgi:hypothetical protein
MFGVLRGSGRAQSRASISTNKATYLAGETIGISGAGFAPFENVSLIVTHAGGAAEGGAGHERFFVTADANGAFTTRWSISSNDEAGPNFVVTASGASGATAQASFTRTGRISLDRRSYRPGETVGVTAVGFNPDELVNIQLGTGTTQVSQTAQADNTGKVITGIKLPHEGVIDSNSLQVEATSVKSMINFTMPLPYFVVVDQNGANDVPAQVDMTQMGRIDSGPTYDIFMSWASTNSWTGSGSTGDACALFNTDGDSAGNIGLAVCGEITNQNGNPSVVVQTAGSPFIFNCSSKRNDRCSTPSPWLLGDIAAAVQSGTLATLKRTGTPDEINLITPSDPFVPGKNNSTLRIVIQKGALPANAKLVNLCSYPSAGNGGNNNPFDCIVPPGGNGFLQVNKNAPTADNSTAFTFNFTGGSTSTYKVSGSTNPPWTTGGIPVPIGTYSISETAIPSGWSFGSASCTNGGTDSGTPAVSGIAVTVGAAITCTFNNNSIPHLTLQDTVSNMYGGTATPSQWTLNAACTSSTTCGTVTQSGAGSFSGTVNPGTYTLSETGGPSGYTSGAWSCDAGTLTGSSLTVTYGQNVTCTIVNSDQPGTLIVNKVVNNTNGGTSTAGKFSFQLGNGSPIAFQQNAANPLAGSNTLTLSAGTYSITEPAVTGYTASYSNCTSVVLVIGGTQTCTITNTAQSGTLTVNKIVDNTAGGTMTAGSFSFQVNNGTAVAFQQSSTNPLAGSNTINLAAGTYTITEPAVTGYKATYSGCSNITLSNGGSATCTITNTAQNGTLTVNKIVDNTAGGTMTAGSFSFQVNNGTAVAFQQSGTNPLAGSNTISLAAGTYTITEPAVTGYKATYSGCSNITLSNGGSATCTITNTAQNGTLTVNKIVDNTAGGTMTAGSFSFQVNNGTAVAFQQSGTNPLAGSNTVSLAAGTYNITEPAVTGYKATYSGCSNINLSNAGSATCTITNTAQKASPSVTAAVQIWTIKDSITLKTVRTGGGAGTVTFTLYSDNACSVAVGSDASPLAVDSSGNGTASTPNGVVVTVPQTYYWIIKYSGDNYNSPYTTTCGSETTTIAAKNIP